VADVSLSEISLSWTVERPWQIIKQRDSRLFKLIGVELKKKAAKKKQETGWCEDDFGGQTKQLG
jgi:hypothetical protein